MVLLGAMDGKLGSIDEKQDKTIDVLEDIKGDTGEITNALAFLEVIIAASLLTTVLTVSAQAEGEEAKSKAFYYRRL